MINKGLLVKWNHATPSRWYQGIDTPTDRKRIRGRGRCDQAASKAAGRRSIRRCPVRRIL
jgi:hypothetical protein